MRLVIVLRQSPDWTDRNAVLAQAAAFSLEFDRPPDQTHRHLTLWDATFGITFCETRHRLKQLTLENFARVPHATVIPVADVAAIDPDAWYLFSDDDDWYAPHVGRILDTVPATCDGVTWQMTAFKGDFRRRAKPRFCFPNNYAVRGAWLATHQIREVLQHGSASAIFYGPGFRLDVLPDLLSLENKHPCSTVMLETVAEQPNALRASVDVFNARCAALEIPDEYGWARAELAGLSQLFADVGASARPHDTHPPLVLGTSDPANPSD